MVKVRLFGRPSGARLPPPPGAKRGLRRSGNVFEYSYTGQPGCWRLFPQAIPPLVGPREGYVTLCQQLPSAKIVDGPEGWGSVIVWNQGDNLRSHWYDPFPRFEVAKFHALEPLVPSSENEVRRVARTAAQAALQLQVDRDKELARRHPRSPSSPRRLQVDVNPFCGGGRYAAVEKAVLALLTPSKRLLSRVERFVREWGIPEYPLPAEYNALAQAMSAPAYPLLRFLYLAYEMHYVVQLVGALQDDDGRLVGRTSELLVALIANRPCNPPTALARDEYSVGEHSVDVDLQRIREALRSGPASPHVRALRLVNDVFKIRLRDTVPAMCETSEPQSGSALFSASWECPDLLSAMWTMLHMQVTGAWKGVGYCLGCGMPFLKPRLNKHIAPGHEHRCGKSRQRSRNPSSRGAGPKPRRSR